MKSSTLAEPSFSTPKSTRESWRRISCRDLQKRPQWPRFHLQRSPEQARALKACSRLAVRSMGGRRRLRVQCRQRQHITHSDRRRYSINARHLAPHRASRQGQEQDHTPPRRDQAMLLLRATACRPPDPAGNTTNNAHHSQVATGALQVHNSTKGRLRPKARIAMRPSQLKMDTSRGLPT